MTKDGRNWLIQMVLKCEHVSEPFLRGQPDDRISGSFMRVLAAAVLWTPSRCLRYPNYLPI